MPSSPRVFFFRDVLYWFHIFYLHGIQIFPSALRSSCGIYRQPIQIPYRGWDIFLSLGSLCILRCRLTPLFLHNIEAASWEFSVPLFYFLRCSSVCISVFHLWPLKGVFSIISIFFWPHLTPGMRHRVLVRLCCINFL